VVVVVGETAIDMPLVTGMAPGLMTPDPPLKIGVKVEDVPTVIVADDAVKPLIDGRAITDKLVLPWTDPEVAAIVVKPGETPVARPELFTVAIKLFELDHPTELVTSPVLLSVYVAVAVNGCVRPTEMAEGEGVTAMLTICGAPTVSVVDLEMLCEVAVMVAVPTPELVARPLDPTLLLTIATVANDVDQVTLVVMSFVLLSV
jgi:hypothetical protein